MAILNGRLALGLVLAMVAVPSHSQSRDLGLGVGSVSPEALKASEARVKAWYARPDILALKAEAEAGKAAAQVQFADRIRDDLLGESWSRDKIRENMMKYYAMAMGQKYAPAFARVGLLAESVEYGMRDLDESLDYYRQGAEAGDRDAVAGYVRLAFNPSFCSFCEDGGDLKTDYQKLIKLNHGNMKRPEIFALYRAEKRDMIAKAIDFALVARPRSGDEASHLLAGALQTGIAVPQIAREQQGADKPFSFSDYAANSAERAKPQWLLEPDLEQAVTILSNLSGRGDIMASRKLADIYLTGRIGSGGRVIKDPGKYVFYMKRAVDAGSILAAYSLGFELLSGRTIPADHVQGFEYAAKAALAGFGPAQVTAAYAYREGRGVAKNEALALALFEKAANNSQLDGAEQAAAMHRAGRGTPGGRVQIPDAVFWEKKAAAIKALSPAMAEAVRRVHFDKFK